MEGFYIVELEEISHLIRAGVGHRFQTLMIEWVLNGINEKIKELSPRPKAKAIEVNRTFGSYMAIGLNYGKLSVDEDVVWEHNDIVEEAGSDFISDSSFRDFIEFLNKGS